MKYILLVYDYLINTAVLEPQLCNSFLGKECTSCAVDFLCAGHLTLFKIRQERIDQQVEGNLLGNCKSTFSIVDTDYAVVCRTGFVGSVQFKVTWCRENFCTWVIILYFIPARQWLVTSKKQRLMIHASPKLVLYRLKRPVHNIVLKYDTGSISWRICFHLSST